jgi:hypothetical protein
MLKIISLMIIFFLSSFSVQAKPLNDDNKFIKKYISSPQKVGEGKLSFLFWDIYNATLYSSNGRFDIKKPFALKIEYLMEFSGEEIAIKTIKEMKRQGFKNSEKLKLWQKKLEVIFPSVKSGTILTGIYTKDKKTIFYNDGIKFAEIEDPEFGEKFFNIWLGNNSRDTNLTNILQGKKND